jgi:hypothetical protein
LAVVGAVKHDQWARYVRLHTHLISPSVELALWFQRQLLILIGRSQLDAALSCLSQGRHVSQTTKHSRRGGISLTCLWSFSGFINIDNASQTVRYNLAPFRTQMLQEESRENREHLREQSEQQAELVLILPWPAS